MKRRDRLLSDLRGAVGRGEITAVYQPQFSLTSGRIVCAETLSRWEHPSLGAVSPGEFIPIAEESGLISEIGEHMIRLGARAAARWQDHAVRLEVAINVSLRQLADHGFVSRFNEAIAAASADPHLITVEITESTAANDVPTAAGWLTLLAATGVTVSIDDFGAGQSSEQQVDALPATEVKIDLHLVQDESAARRLESAIRFGKSRGMRIVAEGVETARQLQRVRDLGCDRAQGYLLGRPAARAELDALLA